MSTIVVVPPSQLPLTLEEAREQCRASPAEDALLARLIRGAAKLCEGIIQQAIMQRTVEQAWDTFPPEELLLSARPVVSIASVQYTNLEGAPATLDPAAYALDNRGTQPWLLPARGTSWPATESTVNAVRARYVVGMAATAAEVPDDIRTWLLLTVAYLYAQREAFDMTGRVSEVPSRFVDGLLDPYRRYDYTA